MQQATWVATLQQESKAVDLLKYPMYMSCAKENGNKAETFSGHLSGIFAPHDTPITLNELKITHYFPNAPSDAS